MDSGSYFYLCLINVYGLVNENYLISLSPSITYIFHKYNYLTVHYWFVPNLNGRDSSRIGTKTNGLPSSPPPPPRGGGTPFPRPPLNGYPFKVYLTALTESYKKVNKLLKPALWIMGPKSWSPPFLHIQGVNSNILTCVLCLLICLRYLIIFS